MADTTSGNEIISSRVAIALLAVVLVAFSAAMTLAAWSPELSDKNKAGSHAYSASATGYKAFVSLVEATGQPISYRRNTDNYHDGLSIIAPGTVSSEDALSQLFQQSTRTLVVLPKWFGRTDTSKPAWFENTTLMRVDLVNALMARMDASIQVSRVDAPSYATLDGERFRLSLTGDVQVFSDHEHEHEILVDTPNGALVVWDVDTEQVYLSDPDLFNTMGLASYENAKLALALVERLELDSDPEVLFDVTLAGFSFETSLMRILLDVPYLSITLISLAAAGLLGWAAFIRFGSPQPDQRVHALGKEALADHTAGLFKMARRERQMAPGYLELQKEMVCEALRIPRHLDPKVKTDMLDRLGEQAGTIPFSVIEQELSQPARNTADLIHKAQRLYRWRQEILNES